MTAVAAAERRFALAWPRQWRRPPAIDGLLTVCVPCQAASRPADVLLTADERRSVVWSPAAAMPERQALARREQPGVRVVCLARVEAGYGRLGLAVQVASHLAVAGTPRRGQPRPLLVSPTKPGLCGTAVRIPHLVTAAITESDTADVVVWELLDRGTAEEWFGGRLPDQTFIEEHLPGLLRLRAAARAGRMPDGAAGRRLGELLHGRELPLSITLVYRHLDVFGDLLATRAQP